MDQSLPETALSLDDFAYDLPDELIAQEPPPVRHASRLLHINRSTGRIEDRMFTDLPDLLAPGDLLVVNDTRVIPARLLAARETGGQVEILLLRPEAARPGLWLAMATPLRKLKQGEALKLANAAGDVVVVDSIVTAEDGQKRVLLDFNGQDNVYRVLSERGLAPLPPYIKREPVSAQAKRDNDLERYQTIFAQAPGAVAAPTAGLHFSQQIFDRLAERGVEVCKLTLHVGPGTFKPITSTLEDHSIEAETYSINAETARSINQALADGRRVVAVGTTSCRALETAGALAGAADKHSEQIPAISPVQEAQTRLYIRPGYDFRVIGGLVTNFHLSRSSLLVLVTAFGGYDLVMRAYRHAVAERYRFFSYGDACLLV